MVVHHHPFPVRLWQGSSCPSFLPLLLCDQRNGLKEFGVESKGWGVSYLDKKPLGKIRNQTWLGKDGILCLLHPFVPLIPQLVWVFENNHSVITQCEVVTAGGIGWWISPTQTLKRAHLYLRTFPPGLVVWASPGPVRVFSGSAPRSFAATLALLSFV